MKALVISSGGVRGFGFLGMLHSFVTFNSLALNDFEIMSGSSVGGLICALLSMGKEPLDIYVQMLTLLPLNLIRHRDVLLEKLKSMIGPLTFKKLYETKGSKLLITSYDISTKSPIFYSYLHHPDVEVYQAVAETINIPFILNNTKCKIDGAIASPFPLHATITSFEPDSILGLYSLMPLNDLFPIRNPYDDVKNIIGQLYNNNVQLEIAFAKCKTKIELVEFECDISFELFEVSEDIAKELFSRGMSVTLNSRHFGTVKNEYESREKIGDGLRGRQNGD